MQLQIQKVVVGFWSPESVKTVAPVARPTAIILRPAVIADASEVFLK